MLIDIFPYQIFKTSINLSNLEKDAMRDYLSLIFKDVVPNNHSLEKAGGKSTHAVDRELHKNKIFQPLVDHINLQSLHYWANLHLATDSRPKIVSMWANLHLPGAFTELHSHATHIMAGCYYLDFPTASGKLVFQNPAEYATHYYPFTVSGKEKFLEYIADVVQDDLIIFPAHIKHNTKPNRSTLPRISINFNLNQEEI